MLGISQVKAGYSNLHGEIESDSEGSGPSGSELLCVRVFASLEGRR